MDWLNLGVWMGLLKQILIACSVLYVLFAIALQMLAAKLRIPGPWQAWIPLWNFVYLCRVAGVTPAILLLMFVPLVQFVAAGYIGVQIARRRGKSAVLGAMMPVPIVGLICLYLLAIGKNSAIPAPVCPVCPVCGRPDCVGEVFCGYTGQRIQTVIQAPAPAAATGGSRVFAVVMGLLLLAGVGFLLAGLFTKGKTVSPVQAASRLPSRTAGVLKEFPIDTDRGHPATPSAVVSQSFPRPAARPKVRIPARQLPPFYPPEALPAKFSTVAAADYRSVAGDRPVSVVVGELQLELRNDMRLPVPEGFESRLGAGAAVSGVEVKNPAGATYAGVKVKDGNDVYYLLRKHDAPIVLIVSARDGAPPELAERLAQNAGNGDGLLEYPEVRESMGDLPTPPPGMELLETQTITNADMTTAIDQVTREAGQGIPPEAASLVQRVRMLLPEEVTLATYGGQDQNRWKAAVGSYSSGRSAWMAMQTLRMLASGALRSGSTRSGSCYFVRQGSLNGVLMQRGNNIAIFGSEDNAAPDRLAAWADTYEP